ncbi:MAG: cytochrome c, partial [Pirellulales bacterium]|nr:cytochrome c [Pirellulales bacterium]
MTTRKRTLYFTLLLIYVATMEQAIAQEPSGIVLFRKHCSHCHGNNGAGSESYPDPLRGNLSVNQLASYIDKAMPEDDPSQVTGETAEIIAETIHSSFYSRIAQEKKRKARLDLSHLTVRQMQESLADIIGSSVSYTHL